MSDLASELDRLDEAATDGAHGAEEDLYAWLRNHTDEIKAALAGPAPCDMTRTEPFDFAQCETHDTTQPWDPTPHAFKGHGDQCTGCGQLAHHRTHDQLPSSSVAKRQAADHHPKSDPDFFERSSSADPSEEADAQRGLKVRAEAEVERLRAAIARVEALAETWRRKAGRGVWLLDHAAADISTALAGADNDGDQPAACGAPIGAGTYGCPSVYGPPPTCVLPAGHDGLHMRDVSDPSGDRPVAVEPQPEPFDMAPAEIDEFLSALEDPDGDCPAPEGGES